MRKYRWSLLKTLEFLNSRRPDLEIRVTFIQQLSDYENRLKFRGLGVQTKKWSELAQENNFLESEELLLRNTFVNSRTGAENVLNANLRPLYQSGKPTRLKWVDLETRGHLKVAFEGPIEDDLVNKINPAKVVIHKRV